MAISVNASEYKSVIGLDSVYVAAVTADSASAYTTGTPEILAPAAEISMKPVTSQETQYADNQPYDVFSSEAETDMEITLTGVPSEMLALLLGGVFNAASGRVWDNAGTPPYFALGFRSMKSNGSYRYYWFMKVQFMAPEEGAATKADKSSPKTIKMTCKAIKTTYKWNLGSSTDSVKRVFGDADTTNFSATGWFTQVQTPSVVAPDALALSSSVPTDNATGISITANQTLTFNNALNTDAIYNVALLLSTSYTVVAATITIDATKKIITIDPTSSLTGSTVYVIVYNVTDIYGQHLSGAVNFTTV